MPMCRCPKCNNLLILDSSSFGDLTKCEMCKHGFVLDTTYLAHFELPDRIGVYVSRSDGRLWTGEPVTVLLRRGLSLPPLLTALDGTLVVTRELFQQAEEDAVDFMARGDPSLLRYVDVVIPTRRDAEELASRRRTSGWSITPLERKLHGTMRGLLRAYTIGAVARQAPVCERLDLAKGSRDATVRLQL